MRKKTLFTLVAMLFGFALVAAACSSDDSADDAAEEGASTESSLEQEADDIEAEGATQNIVEIASEVQGFSTLVSLVGEAGLAETLSGTGPYTVMAPTDDAFAEVPAATLDELKADPTGKLADVLKLHVISGELDSAALEADAGTCVETLGGKVKVEKDGDTLTFGGATVDKVDVVGSNGIIHEINGVVTAASTDC